MYTLKSLKYIHIVQSHNNEIRNPDKATPI